MPASKLAAFCSVLPLALAAAGCTGLQAGPETASVTVLPASRDSAFVRARRALQGESFTLDLVDSTGGRLSGTRWPGSNAHLGTSTACHVSFALRIQCDAANSEIATTSRWIAPSSMSEQAPRVCEQERAQVLERTDQVLVPLPTP